MTWAYWYLNHFWQILGYGLALFFIVDVCLLAWFIRRTMRRHGPTIETD